MEFSYNEVLDLWIAEAECRGRQVQVRLYCRDDADFSGLGCKAIRDVELHWESLKTAIISDLLPQFNELSGQQATADEFLARLILTTIDFDAVDIMYTLFWSDGGLFGGHSIQVLWDPERQFHADVSLVG